MQAAKFPAGREPSDVRKIRTHGGAFNNGNDDIEVEIADSDELCRRRSEVRQSPVAVNRPAADTLATVTLLALRTLLPARGGRCVLPATATATLL